MSLTLPGETAWTTEKRREAGKLTHLIAAGAPINPSPLAAATTGISKKLTIQSVSVRGEVDSPIQRQDDVRQHERHDGPGARRARPQDGGGVAAAPGRGHAPHAPHGRRAGPPGRGGGGVGGGSRRAEQVRDAKNMTSSARN